ncbi:MAG: Holliday junction branch migration protein RuvA [Acholeplasmatales bacterium]|nr:Holliday junction branch migration protein RuvA [Acholeplasmatales bacterium]
MYGYIIGTVTKVTPKNIICENNNIGYLIIVPNPYNYSLNKEYKIFLHQYVREDAIELYGFLEEEEKDMFLKLISVSGIGPKSALSILATGTVKEIVDAIESHNDHYLRKFPGIGAKASQQIVLDLAGKLNFDNIKSGLTSSKLDDVEDALIALGYNKKEITKVISKLDASKEVGELVKEALKKLVK